MAQHDVGGTVRELLQPEGLQVADVVDAAEGAGVVGRGLEVAAEVVAALVDAAEAAYAQPVDDDDARVPHVEDVGGDPAAVRELLQRG